MNGAFPAGEDQTTVAVRRAMDGDSDSLQWLVARLSPLLHAQARHRLRTHLQGLYEPEDLVQDVWLRTLPKLGELRARDGRMTPVLLRFLSEVLVRRYGSLLQKHLYGKPLQQEIVGRGSEFVAATTAVIDRASRSEHMRTVSRCIEELPDREREIMVLRGVEQASNAEAAQVLGLSPGNVAVIYHRSLSKLRERLPDSVFADLRE